MERQLRVLIIEDSNDLRELLVLTLNRKGWEVFTAKDGRDALRVYHDAIEDKMVDDRLVAGSPFDVLLIDVIMPRLNGFGFGVIVRRFEGFTNIRRAKHIYLTGRDDVVPPEQLTDTEFAGALFADAYIRKPIDMADLIVQIEKLVNKEAAGAP